MEILVVIAFVGFLFLVARIGNSGNSGNPNRHQDVTFKIGDSDSSRAMASSRGSSVADAFSQTFQKLERQAAASQRVETISKYVSGMEEAVRSMEERYPRFDLSSYRNRCHVQRQRLDTLRKEKEERDRRISLRGTATVSHGKMQQERNALTKSLRYEILQRDNFRCCICGRTAADGVTLHVDHIVPVSKGGKTERSNLRTLCADCNLGKSNKAEKIAQ